MYVHIFVGCLTTEDMHAYVSWQMHINSRLQTFLIKHETRHIFHSILLSFVHAYFSRRPRVLSKRSHASVAQNSGSNDVRPPSLRHEPCNGRLIKDKIQLVQPVPSQNLKQCWRWRLPLVHRLFIAPFWLSFLGVKTLQGGNCIVPWIGCSDRRSSSIIFAGRSGFYLHSTLSLSLS